MKVVVGLTAVALTIAGPVTAQTHPPQDRITTALDRAREVGIPVVLLESKIAEGKAKGVSMERIAAAIEHREAALEKARDALRDQPDADESLSVAADAVETGVSGAVLKAIAQSAPRDRRNVAIAALTELVHQGHGSQQALDRVRDALKRGPDALANLPAEAASHRGTGASGHEGDTRSGESATPSAVPPAGRGPGSGSGGPGSSGAGGPSGNSGPGSSHRGR
jgi:ABC-type sugar transport system substrate-binding protein